MADIWAHGDAYERFMGRWSRLRRAAVRALAARARRAALGRRRLRERRPHLGDPRPLLPRLGAGRRPERGRQVEEARRPIDDPRVELRGAALPSDLPAGSFDVVVLRAGAQLRPATPTPRSPRWLGPRRAASWRRTSGTTPGGCRCCGRSGTWPARSTPSAIDLDEGHRFACANRALCRRCGRARGSPTCAAAGSRSPRSSATSTTCGSRSSAGRAPAPAYVASSLDARTREPASGSARTALASGHRLHRADVPTGTIAAAVAPGPRGGVRRTGGARLDGPPSTPLGGTCRSRMLDPRPRRLRRTSASGRRGRPRRVVVWRPAATSRRVIQSWQPWRPARRGGRGRVPTPLVVDVALD